MAPISDEEWADLVAHELPKTSDPVIQNYLKSRRALMAEDLKQRSDHSFRQALSPIANKACDIVSQIREEERRTADRTTPKETRTWQIIRRLPKGALLRGDCHSLVHTDHLLEAALATPGMCIACQNGPSIESEDTGVPRLCIRFRGKPDSEGDSLRADDYKPRTFIPLVNVAADGGKSFLSDWLKGRFGDPRQDSDIDDTGATPSARLEAIRGMLFYEPIWRAFLRRLMANLVEDGVYWVELRLTFPLAYYREGSETPDPDYDHLFQVIEEEVAEFQATDAGRPFWGLRVIWSTGRSQDPRSIIEDADNCIATKLIWPQLVAGYDLAGSGSLGTPLADRLPELFWFRKQCALEGVQVPFLLRAASESLGATGAATTTTTTTTTADGNLFDALLLGARRIGCALSLHKHPRLVEAVKDRRILVEISSPSSSSDGAIGPTTIPGSNTMQLDSLSALLAQGVPCALCDDGIQSRREEPAGVGSRMTSTFWRALHASWRDCSTTIDLATLGSLAENSVRWAAFEDQDAESWARDVRAASVGAGVKASRLQQWAVEWERFCLWVVTEYGDADVDDAAELTG